MIHDDEGAVLIPTSGVGKEVYDYLVGKLGIPQTCTEFSVHFGADTIVSIRLAMSATEQPKRNG